MRIEFTKNQILFLKETLMDVDKRSCDPVYKTVSERVFLSLIKEGGKEVERVIMEDHEVYTLIEALRDRSEHAQTKKDIIQECNALIKFIEEKTSLSL